MIPPNRFPPDRRGAPSWRRPASRIRVAAEIERVRPMDERAVFDESFAALTGHRPLDWQRRLFLERLIRGDVPPALDIPTWLGKTSVTAIWLVARAFAGEKARRELPRRLIYVVDRRAAVDQATSEAQKPRATQVR